MRACVRSCNSFHFLYLNFCIFSLLCVVFVDIGNLISV